MLGPLAAFATLLWGAAGAAPGPAPTLSAAIEAYEALDDGRAIDAFQRILAENPPREIAGKAHLYLGLLAFNSLHADLAAIEFRKAIETDPAIDLPLYSSPKATLAFAEARRAVTR